MLFFKQKHKIDELLPPPPPSSDLELEQEKSNASERSETRSQLTEKPKFFDELVKPKKAESIPEEEEFGKLVKEVEGLKPKKALIKKPVPKKELRIKQKIPAKQLKKIETKKLKERIKPKKSAQVKPTKKERLQLKKTKAIKKNIKKPRVELPELEEDFGLKGIDFELPKELEEPKEEIKLPETLEDFDIDELGKELGQKAKPKEILEAQEEIQGAIDKIKKKERPSFLGRLFKRKEKEKQEEGYPTFSIPNGDELSIIQSSIKKARGALMRFDLETAKRNYIEIMRLYNNLSPQDKAKVYNYINELYYERKSAEELEI